MNGQNRLKLENMQETAKNKLITRPSTTKFSWRLMINN